MGSALDCKSSVNQFESDCGLLDTTAVEGWCPDLSDIQVVLEFNSQCCYLIEGKMENSKKGKLLIQLEVEYLVHEDITDTQILSAARSLNASVEHQGTAAEAISVDVPYITSVQDVRVVDVQNSVHSSSG